MIVLPDQACAERLKLLQWPLPKGLMPWLYEERGLRLVILPQDTKKAKRLLHDHFGVKEHIIKGDGRLRARTSHYCPVTRTVVMTYDSFWSHRGENVFHHEIGHAVDFLYNLTRPLSYTERYWFALQPDKPLNDYCAKKLEKNGNQLEQFACSFSAFFKEPEGEKDVNTVEDLSDELVELFQENIVRRFE